MHFSRTTSALNSRQPFTLAGSLLLALALLVAWLLWFFGASVPITVNARIVETTGDGYVRAVISPTLASSIAAGQTALLSFPSAPNAHTVPATVVAVSPGATETVTELYAELSFANADLFTQQLTGQATIVVERVSPALSFLRATGQFIDAAPISFQR